MKAVLVARDAAPSGAFKLLKLALENRGVLVTDFLGEGKPLTVTTEMIEAEVRARTNIVAIGMSSSKELAEPEIAACRAAVTAGIPFGFYGDTYRCHERAREGAWFGQFREQASFFFALNDEEAREAVKTFPSALVTATGNPLWEEFAFPKFTREEVREKLGSGLDEKFILSPGGKSPVVNILVWGSLIEAARILTDFKTKIKLILAPHPGDRTVEAVDPLDQKPLGIYGDLVKFTPVPVEFTSKGVKTSELLPGADIVVEWGSSIGIEAAHLRIPVVSFVTEVGKKRLASISGSEKWEPVELGVSVGVNNYAILVHTLGNLISGGHQAESLRRRQTEVYPVPPAKGAAVVKMATTLLGLAKLKEEASSD